MNWKIISTSALLVGALAGCASTPSSETENTRPLLSTLETCNMTLDASIEFQAADVTTSSGTLSALRIYVLRTDNIANQSKEPLRSQLILRAGPFRNPDFEKGFVVTDEQQAAKDAFDAACESVGVSLNVN